jgi:hypothetical protein
MPDQITDMSSCCASQPDLPSGSQAVRTPVLGWIVREKIAGLEVIKSTRVSYLFQKVFQMAFQMIPKKWHLKHSDRQAQALQRLSRNAKVFHMAFQKVFQTARHLKRNAGRLSTSVAPAIESSRNECLRRT